MKVEPLGVILEPETRPVTAPGLLEQQIGGNIRRARTKAMNRAIPWDA